MLIDGIDDCLQFLEFHEVVSLVDRFVLGKVFLLPFEFLIALEVNLFLNEIFLGGKLFDPGIKRLLSFLDALLIHVLFVSKGIQIFLEPAMPDDCAVEFSLFHDEFIEGRGTIDNVFPDQFCFSFLVLDVLLSIFDFGVELLDLDSHMFEIIMFA